jgi:hypothetical protein
VQKYSLIEQPSLQACFDMFIMAVYVDLLDVTGLGPVKSLWLIGHMGGVSSCRAAIRDDIAATGHGPFLKKLYFAHMF